MRKAFAEYKKSIKEEGAQEGIQKGIQKGIQEGIQKGIQKGAEESRNEIVTNMLMDHCPIATIEKYTQLRQEQILQIARTNNIPLP